MISLTGVNKYYNYKRKNEIHVINNTTLDLPDKGLVALLGPSGCGKTTLLNSIGGLDRVKTGKIFINGKRITGRSMGYVDKIRNLNIGYIFQNYYLVDFMSVFDNVALTLKMLGIKDKEEIKSRVNYVLETLGIYRYRNRPASMLSGGERQRVGIARAIVKNPSIIIADEPTGNLDSANTIEIMNIIKSISKTRLVILVTHENDIAKFYADRILEINDGSIVKDYENKNDGNLDYRIENKFYLKDFKHNSKLENKDNQIEIYNDKENDLKLTIVVKNNNIYIKGSKNQKIEIVDDNSNIEFINEHYKQIDKSIYEKYEFKFEKINNSQKLKYSSIFNPITLITNGFKKILNYSFIKKLLLLGFLASGMFICYSICNLFGITNIKDESFVTQNKNYYSTKILKNKIEEYNYLESLSSIDYIIPGSSNAGFRVLFQNFYQLKDSNALLNGSLTSNDYLQNSDLISGVMPHSEYEIAVDKMVIEKALELYDVGKMSGVNDYKELLNKKAYIKNMKPFTIVGITDTKSPVIYIDKKMIINVKAGSYKEDDYYYYFNEDQYDNDKFVNYELIEDLKLVKGRLPQNDYEVLVNSSEEYNKPLNKEIDTKIGGHKLVVVGYFEDDFDYETMYVNENTIKYNLISTNKDVVVMPKDVDNAISDFNNRNYNLLSIYNLEKEDYVSQKKTAIEAGLVVSGIILLISFIEIYLMIRASFLSRIKEIGIFRAIGLKKLDIYKMFFGEIFAITTLASLPGTLFMSYALKQLQVVSYIQDNYMVNIFTILVSIIVIYIFNILMGLLPVMRVVKDTPAKILSRKDID